MAKPVEFCENRQVLAAILIKSCENCRVLQEASSSARNVKFWKTDFGQDSGKNQDKLS